MLRGSTQLWDCGIGISAIGEQVYSWASSIWFATVAVPCQAETYLDLTRARVTHEQGSTLLEMEVAGTVPVQHQGTCDPAYVWTFDLDDNPNTGSSNGWETRIVLAQSQQTAQWETK